MDGLLNKGKEMLSGNNSNQGGAAPQEGNPQQGGNAGQEDYGDKGLDFIEKKTGHSFSRDQNEKVTDAARGFYEKQTGNKVDPKYSN